jgi:hypothetical protein
VSNIDRAKQSRLFDGAKYLVDRLSKEVIWDDWMYWDFFGWWNGKILSSKDAPAASAASDEAIIKIYTMLLDEK